MAARFLAAHGVDLDAEMERVQFGYNASSSTSRTHVQMPVGTRIDKITGVLLPWRDPGTLWDVSIIDGRIGQTWPHTPRPEGGLPPRGVLEAHGLLLAPSLCHAHIHLDKCFLLQDPKFADLRIQDGDFNEAMTLTSTAKTRFAEDDLLRRGRQLITESLQYGVTCMRAFAEVDEMVEMRCIDAALKLKREFNGICDIQVCAFAQHPLFSDPLGPQRQELFKAALRKPGVEVAGGTPYVEADAERKHAHMHFIFSFAKTHKIDLHLDYSLNPNDKPLVWDAILQDCHGLVLGHCTRHTLFSDHDWEVLAEFARTTGTSFVGLPTSDLFMMRAENGARGTLRVLDMILDHDIDAAISVNNVGNAFTPQGSCDPLSVASMCVGVYHAGTGGDAELLYECVSARAKKAIGLKASTLSLIEGEPADLILFGEEDVPWRTRKSIPTVIYEPPHRRKVIKGGYLVSG